METKDTMETNNDITIKNFRCSKHGRVKPIPKCPECLQEQHNSLLDELLSEVKKKKYKIPPRNPSLARNLENMRQSGYNQALEDVTAIINHKKLN